MIYEERNIKEYVNHIIWGIALRNPDKVFRNVEKNPMARTFGNFIDVYTNEISDLIIQYMTHELDD